MDHRDKVIELELVELAAGGDAVARHEGRVVFVSGGAPGERVRAKVVERKRSFWRAEVSELLVRSPATAPPACALAGRCGGCQWQHVSMDVQLGQKRRILEQALRKLELPPSRPFHGAPAPLGYRRRCRLSWRRRGGVLTLGFRLAGSRKVLDIHACPALTPGLQRGLVELRVGLEAALVADGAGSASLLASGDDAALHLSLRVDDGREPAPEALLSSSIVGVVVGVGPSAQRAGRFAISLDAGLAAGADAFAQANAAQDERLRAIVKASCDARQPRRVLELYAGVGNLTRCLAGPRRRVEAVELAPPAIPLLQRNCEGLPGDVHVREGAAEEALEASPGVYDLLVLDPPREGARALIPAVVASRPKAVLYISCDPMTLARDLAALVEGGYRVDELQGIDMMPQTYHVEAVALLSHRGSSG